MLAQEMWAGFADDGAKGEGDDNRVVELAGDGDEVWDQVEGEREVTDEREQECLVAAGYARVAGEPATAALAWGC